MTIEIKTGKLVAGVVFSLLGFCAGVGWALLPANWLSAPSTVHSAPGDPQPALKSVAHDATLAGDGRDSAPLGIANGGVGTPQLANGAVTSAKLANGAVSAPKLNPLAPPSLGQILGFNGANLAWQNAPVGGVRVVDSLGQTVDPFFEPVYALRKVGPRVFRIYVTNGGIGNDAIFFWHTSTDCSGPRYISEDSTRLYKGSQNSAVRLFYAADPFQETTVNSLERIYPPTDDPNQPGHCDRYNPTMATVGSVATFDLSTLGLVPPFHLEF